MSAPRNKPKARTFAEQLEHNLRVHARKFRAEAPEVARYVLRLLDRGECDDTLNDLQKGNTK
jgi:hypothetical protein